MNGKAIILSGAGALAAWGLWRKMEGLSKVGETSRHVSHVALYRLPDGRLVPGKENAIRVVVDDVAHLASTLGIPIAPGFFSGVAARETGGVINEEDIDYHPDGSIRHRTYGLFQNDRLEDSITDPAKLILPLRNFAHDISVKLDAIAKAAGFDPRNPPRDAYAYLAWAHNAGTGEPVKSIRTYGMDWAKTIRRNQEEFNRQATHDRDHGAGYMVMRMIPYANAVLDWVDKYPAAGVV